MKEQLIQIKTNVEELRDADSHICPHSQWQQWVDEGVKVDEKEAYPCTCESYDSVIDGIQDIIDNINSDDLTPEECMHWRNIMEAK